MNERIKELAEQAGFNQMGIYNIIGIEEYHQKFAKLIVCECVSALDEADGSVHHRQCLLEHFGVK